MEKRANRRHAIDTSIVCSHLTTLRCSETVDGRMRNCCSNGLYAELRTRFRAGTILVVRTIGSSRGYSPDDGFRSLALAEVKWTLPRPVEGGIWYATGLRYLMI
ncbi:MAG: hypothetical protein MUC57_07620 [Desulfobacterales bacterium]|jgi:hypothetical protein|nr:hypothetical protein [Desulfobacterales bacterium]